VTAEQFVTDFVAHIRAEAQHLRAYGVGRIALLGVWQHIVAMATDAVTAAVRSALQHAPCSIRALARAADVPASTLVRIQSGDRAATVTVARALAGALRAWGQTCTALAGAVEEAAARPSKGA
jgi:hypothetical protein